MIPAMIGRRWFRRRREPAPVTIPIHYVSAAHAWGSTLTAWLGLTDCSRAYYRDHVTDAPNFQTGTR